MKPTIYLGLGGTGNLAISFAKKLYEEDMLNIYRNANK